MSANITITSAPCCWGVDDVKNPHLPDWRHVLDEAARAGFGGLELGPYGYMPLDIGVVADALAERRLAIVAGTIFDDLASSSNRANLLRQTDEICGLITQLPKPRTHEGQRYAAPYLTVMDWGHDERDYAAGHSDQAPRLDAAAWDQMMETIRAIAEEFHIAGGFTETVESLRAVREISNAALVCKRGARGAVAFPGAIPDDLDAGETGPGFAIEVFNVLGAGDGFISGLLKGWLDGEDWPTTLKLANACGAFAVSRHGCTPAYPSWEELQFFLKRGIVRKDLRNDAELEQIHWSTNRRRDWRTMHVFAFDHRAQLEQMEGASPEAIGAFKMLCLQVARRVQAGRSGYGIPCDGRFGGDALHAAAGSGLWIGRPVEWPGSRPLTIEPALGLDFGGLAEWPRDHVVKALCYCHPDDDAAMWADQLETVERLFQAARRNRLEFLLEVIPSKVGPVDGLTPVTIIQRFYAAGVYPDWWKLEPFASEAAW